MIFLLKANQLLFPSKVRFLGKNTGLKYVDRLGRPQPSSSSLSESYLDGVPPGSTLADGVSSSPDLRRTSREGRLRNISSSLSSSSSSENVVDRHVLIGTDELWNVCRTGTRGTIIRDWWLTSVIDGLKHPLREVIGRPKGCTTWGRVAWLHNIFFHLGEIHTQGLKSINCKRACVGFNLGISNTFSTVIYPCKYLYLEMIFAAFLPTRGKTSKFWSLQKSYQ